MPTSIGLRSGQRAEVNLRMGCLFVLWPISHGQWVIEVMGCSLRQKSQQARLSVATSTQEIGGYGFLYLYMKLKDHTIKSIYVCLTVK